MGGMLSARRSGERGFWRLYKENHTLLILTLQTTFPSTDQSPPHLKQVEDMCVGVCLSMGMSLVNKYLRVPNH